MFKTQFWIIFEYYKIKYVWDRKKEYIRDRKIEVKLMFLCNNRDYRELHILSIIDIYMAHLFFIISYLICKQCNLMIVQAETEKKKI